MAEVIRLHLAVEAPDTLWTGRVGGSPNTGATMIPFWGGALIETPFADCTLLVGSSAGAFDIGIVRLRAYNSPVDHLTVGYNHVPWATNLYLTIKRQVRPWSYFPNEDQQTFRYEDQDVAYVDENTNIPPIARIGPSAACAFIEGDGLARLKFYSDSQAMAGSLSSHAWTFQSGSPATSSIAGTSSVPILVTWSTPGQYWVTYTVTDTNGKTHKRYCRVYIFNRTTDPPHESFRPESLSGTFTDGSWSFQFRMFDDATWLEGAQVVLFTEQFYDSQALNLGTGWTHRENILFVGWVKGSRTLLETQWSEVSFEAYGPVGWLKEAEAWPANLKFSGDAGWHVLPSMTPDRAALHLLRMHSNITNLADVVLTGDTKSLLYADVGESRLYEQVDFQIYDALKGRLVSDHLGRLIAERNQQLIPIASRTAGSLWTLAADDWRGPLDLGEEIDLTRTAQVDFAGFYYDTENNPRRFYSLAPGRELSTGQIERVIGTRADTQSETNALSGLWLAWRNNEFNDVGLPMAGFEVVDIAPQTRIGITLAAADNERGLVWTDKKFWIREVTYTFEGDGVVTTDLRVEAESDGPPGVTNEVPDDEVPPPGDIPPPVIDIPPPPGSFLEIAYVATTSKIGRTRAFYAASPTWVDITGTVISGTINAMVLDPWDLKNRAFVLTTQGIYRSINLNAPAPLWRQIFTPSQFQTATGKTWSRGKNVRGTLALRHAFFVQVITSDNLLYVGRTLDGGGTWTWVQIATVTDPTDAMGFAVGQTNANFVWTAGANGKLYRSINALSAFTFYQSWSSPDLGTTPITNIEVADDGNPAAETIYISGRADVVTPGIQNPTIYAFPTDSQGFVFIPGPSTHAGVWNGSVGHDAVGCLEDIPGVGNGGGHHWKRTFPDGYNFAASQLIHWFAKKVDLDSATARLDVFYKDLTSQVGEDTPLTTAWVELKCPATGFLSTGKDVDYIKIVADSGFGDPGSTYVDDINVPFTATSDTTVNTPYLRKSRDGGATFGENLAPGSQTALGPLGLRSSAALGSTLYGLLGTTLSILLLSVSANAGLGWLHRTAGMSSPVGVVTWSADVNRVAFLRSNRIDFSWDGGVTLEDKTGNWATAMGAAFANPVVLLPVTADEIFD